MKKLPRTTQEQIERILDLRENGFKMPKIAEMVGVSNQVVHYYCHKNNVAKGGQNWQQIARRRPFIRHGKQVKPFTADDDRLIEDLRMGGMRVSHIAKQLDRARTSIRARLITLANHAEGLCQ